MRSKGFTLLEVMVALAIFAVVALALSKVSRQYAQSTENATLRTQAMFVAQNEAALMTINQQVLQGSASSQITAQGQTWQVDKTAQNTISPKVQRIEIRVALYDAEQAKLKSQVNETIYFNYNSKAVS